MIDTTNNTGDHETKLMRAKSRLLRPETCFYGTILANANIEWSRVVPTAGVGLTYQNKQAKLRMYLNPDFIDTLTTNQVVHLLAHEAFHGFGHHLTRVDDRDPMIWNIAADYIINDLLVNDKIGDVIPGGCYNPQYAKQFETPEALYAHLYKQAKEQQQQKGKPGKVSDGQTPDGSGDKAFDQMLEPDSEGNEGDGNKQGKGQPMQQKDGKMSDAARKDIERQMNNQLVQAKAVAKMAGSLSAGLEIYVDGLLEGKIDWEDLLRDFCSERSDDERSWKKPNRRYIHSGTYLPGVDGQSRMEVMVLAIDVSGSHVHFVEPVVAEIKKVHEDLKPTLHVLYFDSSICRHDVFGPDDTPVPNPCGGGGTRFDIIWDYIAKEQIDPKCCCVLTDMYAYEFGQEPSYPVLWLSTEKLGEGASSAPFGKVTYVDLT